MKAVKVALLLFSVWIVAIQMHGSPRDPSGSHSTERTNPSGPTPLSFEELVTLSKTAKPTGPLADHLSEVLNTPFVLNTSNSAQPHRPVVPNLGPVVRVASWNVERGFNFEQIKLALADPAHFRKAVRDSTSLDDKQKGLADSQLASLEQADVLVLNEVDLGLKRTEYRDVARDLAAALHMSYAYGVEFVEVDPIFELGIQEVDLPDSEETARLHQDLDVDHERYLGLHGTAILSRYPIRNVHIFRLPVCYDWYGKEAEGISKLEKGRRWTSDKLFKERITRELRHGGRMALMADLDIPELPTGTATVVAVHLENKCKPECRRRQINALLAHIKENGNPIVMAGDFNTSGGDNTPTSFRYEIMSRVADYKFWLGHVATHFNPIGIFQYALLPAHYFHNYHDPTAFSVPILWENRERGLFKAIENHRFADGYAFDFRGDPDRSGNGRKRTLADSNERAGKGFVPTYAFNRDYKGLGQFKLDWIFVKPFIADPRREGQSYRFAPHFAVTMRELNQAPSGRMSDHPPLTVDLPLSEPGSSVRGPNSPQFAGEEETRVVTQ